MSEELRTNPTDPSQAEKPSGQEPSASRIRYDEAWHSSLLRPILIAILVLCLDVAVVNLVVLAVPDLAPAYPRLLLAAGALSALIGGYTTTILAQEENRFRRVFSFRLAEIGLILILLRLLLWVGLDTWPSVDAMLITPVETFVTGDYLAAAVLAFLSWQFATLITGDFNKMALQPDELRELAEENPEGSTGGRNRVTTYLRGSRADRATYVDRLAIVRRFATRWVYGAILLMLMTAGARFGMPTSGFAGLARQNIDPSIMAAAVIYLLVGLILISQGQLAALRARWALENIMAVDNVLRRWPVYAILLILGMGLLAALMPFGGTFRLAQILNFILNAIQTILTTFVTLILLLISLFINEESPEEALPSDPLAPLQIPPPMPGDPIVNATVPPWIGGAVFWILTGLLLGYAALIYLQGRGFSLAWLSVLWQRLRQAWRTLWGDLRTWQRTVAASMRVDQNDGGTGATRRPSLLRRILGQLSPAEQIQYYYLDTLDRAAAQGIPRRASETPSRYAPRLQATLDQVTAQDIAAQEVAALSDQASAERETPLAEPIPPKAAPGGSEETVIDLTAAFERVKYAARPAVDEDASRIKQLWERMKERLRARIGTT